MHWTPAQDSNTTKDRLGAMEKKRKARTDGQSQPYSCICRPRLEPS
jgi:hypothetical protein